MEKNPEELPVYITHFASGKTEAPKGNVASPVSHGELGAEPGWPLKILTALWDLSHYTTWPLGWRGGTQRMRKCQKAKKENRLKTDETNSSIFCGEEEGEETLS